MCTYDNVCLIDYNIMYALINIIALYFVQGQCLFWYNMCRDRCIVALHSLKGVYVLMAECGVASTRASPGEWEWALHVCMRTYMYMMHAIV